MKNKIRNSLCVLLTLFMTIRVPFIAFAAENASLDEMINDTAQYILEAVPNPRSGSIGGEWSVIGLARSGCEVPDGYYDGYYKALEDYVKERGGVLHDRKYTEYSRVILALTAIGKNPADTAGYNLLMPLDDYDKITGQGINGPVWALIALDCGNYDMPHNPNAKTHASREMYIDYILNKQLSVGGWSLLDGDGAPPDAGITAMALQALSNYKDREDVAAAAEKAIMCLSRIQIDDAGFTDGKSGCSENSAQTVTALCELGIAQEDERFVKNGKTPLENLMTYYEKGKGFKHKKSDAETNLMASEQALYSLAAVKRQAENKNSLYDMSDVKKTQNNQTAADGLSGKNPDVHASDVTRPGKTFADIAGHECRAEIEALAEREIINGKTEETFDPDAAMTRAEFAASAVRALSLPLRDSGAFTDVRKEDWFYKYVNTAYLYGIVSGIGEGEFNPGGTITREEAAVMTARAAKLCGMNTLTDEGAARDILAGFTDYVKASDWAMGSLAFCCEKGIISDDETELKPKDELTRSQIARMLYCMLERAELLNE